jgi:hypothetical protein
MNFPANYQDMKTDEKGPMAPLYLLKMFNKIEVGLQKYEKKAVYGERF